MALSKSEKTEIQGILGREPSVCEWTVFETMWSEHCSYKSTKPVLRGLPTKGSEVVLGVGEDSGIVYFTTFKGKRFCIALSHESHNHPSQILPIEGAATGVGGVVRDVYCMGADVIGVLDSLHFGISEGNGDGMVDEISERVVQGVADYGNALGVPVLGGETIYHSSYNENCLVNVAAVGLVDEARIVRSRVPKEAASAPYDVILLGKSTDMTGFGGAAFSSAVLDEDDQVSNMGAVQVHDPFLKRVVVQAIHYFLDWADQEKIAIGFKDLGAGGISCAASELAVAGGFGADLNLDDVNVAVDGLLPEVIACSETQERFCLVVPRTHTQETLRIFNEIFEMPKLYHHAGAAVIGEVVQDPVFRMRHQGKIVCELPVEAITTEVLAKRDTAEKTVVRNSSELVDFGDVDLKSRLLGIIGGKENCSKRYVYRHFDNAVRGDTVLYPGEGDAVVVSPLAGCDVGLAVSMDSNLYGEIDAYVSGMAAVAESVRNVVAVGARPIAVSDCLNYGNPEVPEVFFDFKEGVRGIGEACEALGFLDGEDLPIISGNVSLYNESKSGNAIVPSPVVCVLGKLADYRRATTMRIKSAGSRLILIGKRYSEFGGTALARDLGREFEVVPQVRLADEARQNRVVQGLISEGNVLACHDISSGGLLACLAEMVLGERGKYSAGMHLELRNEFDVMTWLFSENGGFVLEVSEDVSEALDSAGVWWREIGETCGESEFLVRHDEEIVLEILLSELKRAWDGENLEHLGTRVS